jgi:hypothetical protein
MSLMFQLMANMIRYKHRTNLTSTAIRVFELTLEPKTNFTKFIDFIDDNVSSEQPILTDQLTN